MTTSVHNASSFTPKVTDGPEQRGFWYLLGKLTERILGVHATPAAVAKARREAAKALLKRSRHSEEENSEDPLESLSAYGFDLRLRGLAEVADDVENIAKNLKDADKGKDVLHSVVSLLVALKSDSYSKDGDEDVFGPFFPFRESLRRSAEVPSPRRVHPGCLLYGEIVETASVLPYRHFQPSEFLAVQTSDNAFGIVDPGLFCLRPGSGLTLLSREDQHHGFSKKLGIPDLALLCGQGSGRQLRIPKPVKDSADKICHRECDDDGYVSVEPVDVWDHIWDVEVPKRRTWECLGRLAPPIEKPYLTELGPKGVHLAWVASMQNLRLVDPEALVPELVVISEEELIKHLGYLMIGIASASFVYDSRSSNFIFRSGICIQGVTTETLESFCEEFLVCGTYCRRLEHLCDALIDSGTRILDVESRTLTGLVYKGFLSGLAKYLQGYRTAVLNLVKKEKHLLQLSVAFAKLSAQIQFLGKLCKVDQKQQLPTGIELLRYLFDRTLHVSTRDLYFVMVSLLRSSAEAYFRFLERWIYQGVYHEDFIEFGLHSNSHCLSSRNRLYWTGSFSTTSKTDVDLSELDGGGGNFLAEVQTQVLTCGKIMGLLRLCQPGHPLCAAIVQKQPRMKLLVTPLEQNELNKGCQEYVDHMASVCEYKRMSLRQQRQCEAEARRELLRVAHRRQAEHLERIREQRKCFLQEEEKRKRKVLEDLKKQRDAERLRKAQEQEAKRKEDQMYAEISRQKDEGEVRRESEARAEVEALYRRMTEEAEKREVRMKWRIKRLELRSKRMLFWRAENKKMQESLKVADEKTHEEQSEFVEVRVEEDELNNVILVVKDRESNVVGKKSVDNFTEFTDDLQGQILTEKFETLPKWAQTKLMKNMTTTTTPATTPASATSLHEEEHQDLLNSNIFRRRSSGNSSTKRKRPDSFIEGKDALQKRREVSSPEVQMSLAATIDQSEVRMRKRATSRPSELVDGRKRPASKSIEEVLYPARFSQASANSATPVTPTRSEFKLSPAPEVLAYAKDFPGLSDPEVRDPFSKAPTTERVRQRLEAFAPLPLLMENSVLIPLKAQLKVANQAILEHLLVDANLADHFSAIRNYLLFHDGEFAHQLSSSLFCEIRANSFEVLNPSTLNRIVESAANTSTFGCRDPMAANVGFVISEEEEKDEDIFRRLRLGYRVQWPANIILTESMLDSYSQIFSFFLQLRKAIWGLEQVFFSLKGLRGCDNSVQYRRVHLMRHEMLNFVTAMQIYVTTQVLEVSWEEFQKEISDKVTSVDSLHDAHAKYVNKALFRCILSRKARPVHKVIVDLFNIVAEFSILLTNLPWERQEASADVTHPSFQRVVECHKVFVEYSNFLYTVIKKLAIRGYQHHLHDLMMSLNFNGYFEKVKNPS